MLAFRPGRLTREYIDGRRASYVSPLALFLFSVFLLFAAIQTATGESKIADEDHATIKANAKETAIDAQKELPPLRAKRAGMEARHEDTEEIDEEIANLEKVAAVMHGVASGEKIKSTGFTLLDDVVSEAASNPNLAIFKMQSYAYKYSWALIPISVPFLWVLFPFSRRFHFYDHTVFVTYSLSFMTLLTAAVSMAGAFGASGFSALLGIVPPLHMYRQLRGAYGVSRFGGLLRAAALTMFAFLALLIFAMGIAAETGAG